MKKIIIGLLMFVLISNNQVLASTYLRGDNTNAEISVDYELAVFNNYESEEMSVSHSYTKVDIKYSLDDNTSRVDIKGNNNLKVGNNKIYVIVTAQSGREQVYVINVHRCSIIEDIIIYTLIIMTLVSFTCSTAYLVYFLIRRKVLMNKVKKSNKLLKEDKL